MYLTRRNFIAAFFCIPLFISAVYSFVSAGEIAVYGDSQFNESAQERVVKAILRFKPSVIFRVGDIVNDGNDPEQWQIFNRIASPLLNTTEYYPALGNHEYDSPLYFKNFPRIHNQRWYSVEKEGIHFIVLDSNSNIQNNSEQYRWLESDLRKVSPGIKFKIAFFHHPIFSVGPHPEDEKQLKHILLPLFEEYGVCAVFSGHNHNYQRFKYHGIDFIVTGGGGSYLLDRNLSSPYLKKFVKAYHFCLLSAENGYLTVKVIDAGLNVIDDFVISPQRSEGPEATVPAGGNLIKK